MLTVVVLAATPPGAASLPSAAPIEPRVLDAASTGQATFWVELRADPDLQAAAAIGSRAERGRYVYEQLQETAARSQAGLRKMLAMRGVRHDAFWIANAIRVTASEDLLREIAARPEVERITADRAYRLPDVRQATRDGDAAGIEWGIERINAPAVWEEAGTRGEGIVVASIDSGVQFDHPALVEQYRGKRDDGSFDHDYNWFDPSYACGEPSRAPCDNYGHGTHVTGTMVGGDGEQNRIGVAPGAKWIAAKGCETDVCSRYALLAAGQWVLAPTDLAGEHPDPSKRPHIVNSSWGVPNAYDTFYRDTVRAWLASGIFPVFANGNTGPSCGTVGAPASFPESFGVGAFGADGALADFSSRGPDALGGAVKPQLAAPGVDVRSAFPGDSYVASNGTSMAAPHVSGTVALMWSVSPRLERRVDATREILAATAIDTAGDGCGGTPENNNAWGEGRLDARAAVAAAPQGPVGTLEGAVTDAAGGEPVAGATVTVGDAVVSTGDDGGYRLTLPAGAYDVSVEAFGYEPRTIPDVVIEDGIRRLDVALAALPSVHVSGTVRDGSGQGWPLAARIAVEGEGAPSTVTDPATGRYRLRLPADSSHTLRVEPRYPGYEPVTVTVDVGSTEVVRDLELRVEADMCLAPGYRHSHRPLFETFDETAVPPGWEVVDHAGTNQRWRFDDPIQRGNNTGGEGGFGLVDSFQFDLGPHDTSLVSPVVDLSGQSSPTVGFRTDFYSGLGNATAAVDVSVDGGSTWENLWQRVDPVAGPTEVVLELPQAANARVRFHFTGVSAFWWKVDDVFVGTRTCDPIEGGLVVGHVRDRNTGAGVDGATVEMPGGEPATTAADGFYWLFSPATGPRAVAAAARNYAGDSVTADVAPHAATPAELSLPAGRVAAPDEVEAAVEPGRSGTVGVTLANTGTAPVRIELSERDGESGGATALGAGAARQRIRADVSWTAAAGGAPDTAFSPAAPAPAWRTAPDYPIAVQDNAVAAWGGKLYSFGGRISTPVASSYVYDPAARSWAAIAPMPEPRQQPAGAFIDGRYYVTGGWDALGGPVPGTRVYDPSTNRWSAVADNPAPLAASGAAVLDGKLYVIGGCTGGCGSRDVLRYDPERDAWDRLAPYPQFISWQACGGLGDKLYCAGGVGFRGFTTNATFAYDPETDSWTRVADMPFDFAGSGYVAAHGRLLVSGGTIRGGQFLTNEGVAYNPRTDSWSPLPNARHVRFRGGSGCGFYRVGGLSAVSGPTQEVELLPGQDDCGPTDVAWLSVAPRELTLAPGERRTVTLSFAGRAAGTYTAGVVADADTPYETPRVRVKLHVRSAPDTEAPRTTASLEQAGGAPDRPVTIALSAADGGSGVARTEYRVVTDGRAGPWLTSQNAAGEDPFRTSFTIAEPGAHAVAFRSVDAAGNIEPDQSVAFRIVAPPPGAGTGAPPPAGAVDRPASFRLAGPARRVPLAAFVRRGLRVRVSCSTAMRGSAWLVVGRKAAARLRLGRTTVARRSIRCAAGRSRTVVLEPAYRVGSRLRKARGAVRATLVVRLAAAGGRPVRAARRITLTGRRAPP